MLVTIQRVFFNQLYVHARMYGLTSSDLYSKTRRADVVVPRHMAMYLLRTKMGLSFPSIGKQFGDRDHTTIIHACNKIAAMSEKNQRKYCGCFIIGVNN